MSNRSNSNRSHGVLAPLPLGQVAARGWLERQLRIEAQGMSGHLDELEPAMIATPYITREREEKVCVGWSAEISATYWLGLIQLAYTLGDEALQRKAAAWVDGVLAAQEADGYLGAYKATDNRKEDYNAMGVDFAVGALLAYYEATGRADVLEACRRGLLWFVEQWGGHRTDYAAPYIIASMADVYRLTGDERLLKWAEDYMDWLGRNSKWPNHLPAFLDSTLAFNSAHAVAYGGWLALPSSLFCATGRRDYCKAGINAVKKVVNRCFQRTGAPASNNEHLSPPGANCETEYCNFPTYAAAFRRLMLATGRAAYGDAIEKIVFNGSQGAKKKDGRAIAYMSSPNQMFATLDSSIYGNRSEMEVYAPAYVVACCPVQAVRVLPEYVRGMVMTDRRRQNLYLTGYGPCHAATTLKSGARVEMEEITEYPFKETVTLKFTLPSETDFTLNLRIPGWCAQASVAVNGAAVAGPFKAGSYLTLSRTWRTGDTVELRLPMAVRVVEVKDDACSHKRPLAIERGALLFALPIEPEWKAVPGHPLTPLPEGWSWYEARPRQGPDAAGNRPWACALEKQRVLKPGAIQAEYRDIGGAFPWETSPVVLKVPARRVRHAYTPGGGRKNVETYGDRGEVGEDEAVIELVPYGCTNLRIAYFPRL